MNDSRAPSTTAVTSVTGKGLEVLTEPLEDCYSVHPILNLLAADIHVHPERLRGLIAAYANDWPQLLGKADLWVYGHTHLAADFFKSGCRVVSNPCGYPNQNTGFDPGFLIEM